MDQSADEVKIEYRKSPDYRVIPATGAWGGPIANGSAVMCNIYFESFNPPEEMLVKIDMNGTPLEEIPKAPEHIAVREDQIALVLTPAIAISIGNWLVEKGNELLKQSK